MPDQPVESGVAELSAKSTRPRRTMFGRIALVLAWTLLAMLVVVVGGAWILYQSAQRIPEFYQAALEVPAETLVAAGADFERNVAQLHNNTVDKGDWKSVFTQEQINGWLQFEFAKKFPNALPQGISDPRVSIINDEIKLAFGVKAKNLSGIVVAAGDLFCTAQKNQIGIRIKSINAGLIPISIDRWANEIGSRLRERRIPFSWTEVEGDPVALITVPTSITDERELELKDISVENKKIVLIGETILSADVDPILDNHDFDPEGSSEKKLIDNR